MHQSFYLHIIFSSNGANTQTPQQLNHLNTHLRHSTLKCKHSHCSGKSKKKNSNKQIQTHTHSYIHLYSLDSCWVSQWVWWSVIITEGLMEGSWMFSGCCRVQSQHGTYCQQPDTHAHTRAMCHLYANSSIAPTLPSPQWLERDCPFSSGEVGGEETAAWYTPEGEFNSEMEKHAEIEDVDSRKQEMWYSMRVHSFRINSLLWWFFLHEVSVGNKSCSAAPQCKQ